MAGASTGGAMKTAKTIAKLYSRTELTAALCDAVANWQASEQARHDADAAHEVLLARLRDLRDQWKARATKMRANSRGTTVESLINQRVDAFKECAAELDAALLVDPLTPHQE